MRFMVLTSIVFILACKSTDDDGQEDTDTDTGPEEILSTFEMGDFRVGSLELNTVGDGPDQNGDSNGDNNLPNALALVDVAISCLLYTSPSPRDGLLSRMPSSA